MHNNNMPNLKLPVQASSSMLQVWNIQTLMYGAELWGCCRQAEPLVPSAAASCQNLLEMGRLHPRSAIEHEMRMMPLMWEAKRRY